MEDVIIFYDHFFMCIKCIVPILKNWVIKCHPAQDTITGLRPILDTRLGQASQFAREKKYIHRMLPDGH